MTTTNSELRSEMRRRKQEKRKQLNKLLLIIFVVLLVIAAVIVIVSVTSNKVYETEDEFRTYAVKYFEDIDGKQEIGTTKQVVEYGQPRSCAIEYPVVNKQEINNQINEIIGSFKKKFNHKYEKAPKEEKVAMLMGYETYKTPQKAMSLVLHQDQQKKEDKKMISKRSGTYTYNFSTKTGRVLSPTQIFEDDYRTFCSKYMLSYFKDKYSKDLIDDRYKEMLADNTGNFNKFAMTDTGVKFYFDKGTVVDSDKGDIAVEISYDELKGTIKDEIAERDIDPNKPMVALTFDDGPYPQSSNRILDCLEKYGVVATFFELGQNASAYPEVLKREAKLGCEVGSHSWSHPNLNTLSAGAVKDQLDKTNKAIKKAIGQPSAVFRPPYGNSNKNVEAYANAPIILWSVDTLDWKSRNAASIEGVVKGVKDLDGRVILMHSIYDFSAEATENLVPWMLEQGYQLVTVKELLQYKYNETPKDGKFYGYNYFYLDNKKEK